MKKDLYRWSKGLAAVLLTMLALWTPQEARAVDYYDVVNHPEKYNTWSNKAPGCVHLKSFYAEYNANDQYRYHEVTFYVKDEQGKREDILYWTEEGGFLFVWNGIANLMSGESTLILTNDYEKKNFLITGNSKTSTNYRGGTQEEQTSWYEFDWYYPGRFAGKTLTFGIDATLKNYSVVTATTTYTPFNKELGKIDFEDISLETYDPVVGTDAADYGYLKVPVSCDKPIKKLEGTYKDSLDVEHRLEDVVLEKASNMAFLRIPSYEGIKSVAMTASVVSGSWSRNEMADPNGPTENVAVLKKAMGTLPMIHGPQALTSEMMDGGNVKLKWEITDLGHEDLVDGDAFMIQRTLTGREDDYTDIGFELFDVKQKYYEHIDTTLISNLDSTQIDKKLGIPLVRYRVVRATAASVWGYEKNPAMAFTQPSINSLALLKPIKATAQWSKQSERKIWVTWDYESSHYKQTYVWDPRAEMRVVMKMSNRKGEWVDSVATILTPQQINAKQVTLTLPRTCVYYMLNIEVDRKKSAIGGGTGDIFVTIGNDDEFKAFIRRVENGENKLNAILTADVKIPEMIDGNDYYSGNFNGNGYYLNVGGLSQEWNNSAPFRYVGDGVVLTNIKVKGDITSSNDWTAALVGLQKGRAYIENCYVTGDMTITNKGGGAIWCGGMVGEAQGSLYISNSMVAARLSDGGVRAYYWGGFVGDKTKDAYVHIRNSFFSPRSTAFVDEKAMNEGSATFVNSSKTAVQWGIYDNSYYQCSFSDLIQGRPGDAPKNSLWYNGEPVMNRASFTTDGQLNVGKYNVRVPDDSFYIQKSGHILENSLTATTHHSAVELRWSCTEDPVDFFMVQRRRKDRSIWETVATDVQGLNYTDETVSPSYDYVYRVASVVDCEGRDSVYTREVEGSCEHFGRLEGYLRFADGTGIPNVTLFVDSESGEKVSRQVSTDEKGYFMVDNLPYGGQETRSYRVTCSLPKSDLSADCGDGIPVVFDGQPKGNLKTNVNFTVTAGVKMSGYVMYKGTSIPVVGASFLIDGQPVSTAAGPVKTNYEGKYEFYMVKGEHSIQATMKGHVFYQNGYYHADERDPESKTKYDFQTDKAGVYFYDDTRVKLIGRVVGGTTQGDLPLGNSLSTNNLGDNLKMVLTLEGDKTSMLVFENTDRSLTERDEEFIHKKHGRLDTKEHKTRVHTSRYRMEVLPDTLTGEYEVLLPPVKWKIQQISADGYATLFQDGTTNEVIDLTDSLTLHKVTKTGNWMTLAKETVYEVTEEYHAIYNRIYRAPIVFECSQVNWDNFNYFGERYYNMRTVTGDSRRIPIAWAAEEKDEKGDKHGVTKYTFGYPVFSLDRPYNIKLAVLERYYYNNNPKDGRCEEVKLSGGHVTIHNGLLSATNRDTLSLDENGEGIYELKVAQRPYIQTGKDALYTVSFSLDRDGTNYEAEPLHAYVFGQQNKPGAKDVVSTGTPVLVDILRDPPGGGSSAKLAKGSTLSMSYKMNMSWAAGVDIGIKAGSNIDNYTGAIAGVTVESGVINHVGNTFDTSVGIVFSGSGERAFNYTMTANEDISTSTSATMVGADADLYIGMETNVVVRPMIALRAVTDSLYQLMQGAVTAGTVVEVASGMDEAGKKYHLIRDEVIGYGSQVKSTFVHSQQHILKQIMPELDRQCDALMFTGTETEAVAQANATGKPIYLSLVAVTDSLRFGVTNLNKNAEYIYYTLKKGVKNHQPVQGDLLNYLIVLPDNYDDATKEDRVKDFGQALAAWANMIAQNEEDKLAANELVKNFDVDGGASINYGESFESSYSLSQSYSWFGSDFSHNYFAYDDPFDSSSAGTSAGNTAAVVGITVGKILAKIVGGLGLGPSIGKVTADPKDDEATLTVNLNIVGTQWTFKLTPVASYSTVPTSATKKAYSRKESFNIAMTKESHLNFDVYRVKLREKTNEKVSATDVFYNENYLTYQDYVKYFLDRKVGSVGVTDDYAVAKGFVYRTRGGATARPWEGERKSLFYNPGTVIDERTKRIENPVIKMDKQSVSGVPYGQPARFKLYLTNDSEAPDAIGISLSYFNLYQDNKKNPAGVKMTVDGLPLTQDGMNVHILPGEVTEKVLEVMPGEAFDYEDLVIGLISLGDIKMRDEVTFDVHFLHEAGGIQIASPGNKWIMNTDAPMSGDQGWYMPVIISGFDRNQKNFDHIEFQYKESTRGDDYWTNLCSFYADSASYKQASGTREMIPDNANIVTKFYGDGREMEKAYDLRARLFVRNGNSYLTNDSEVLSGIKDTHRPQLFGAPDPKDGILGAGDNVVFNFSEDIEYNYLTGITNFEVKGETNETALIEDPSLMFGGKGYAQSEVTRNFSDKSVTIDMMIRPVISEGGGDMPIFSHGSDGNSLQLWVKENRHLMARVIRSNDESIELTSTYPIGENGLQHVALILDRDAQTLQLYCDSIIGEKKNVVYNGYGSLVFGSTNETDASRRKYYKGKMQETRIWYRALDNGLLSTYGKTHLTGYEMGLIDYYPMNEGKGDYASDESQGAHLKLTATDWALPQGMSLSLDKTKEQQGLKLKAQYMQRPAEADYTLMFWFRTTPAGRGALLSNGSGEKTDATPGTFYIGFEEEQLVYRTGGATYVLGKSGYDDDRWHHYAMTVNRGQQLVNIYLDNALKVQFSTDSLGGMTGDDFYLGNMVWHQQGEADILRHSHALTGHIDEVGLFQQALPQSLIKRYSSKSPSGKEKGLITYLGFNRQERQMNNELVLKPYSLNQVVHLDMDGNPTDRVDTVFVADNDYVMRQIDESMGAPIQAYEELRNLNFSFVGKDNQVMVNVDEPDARVNKRNLYVTVYEIPDLNGNTTLSPYTWGLFVDRNPLRWSQKTLNITTRSNTEEEFMVNIENNSGVSHTYTIENLPEWIAVDKMTDVIGAKNEQTLTFNISSDVNTGSYDEVIYLTDENGLSEPLVLNLTVEDEEPLWTVDADLKKYSMNIIGRVVIGDDIVTDKHDMVGVFDHNGVCHGVSRIEYNPTTSESMVYITVFDTENTRKPLVFRLWHYNTGKIIVLEPSVGTINFAVGSVVGTAKEPVIFRTNNMYIQTLALNEGWNWISFNVGSNDFRDIPKWLSQYTWYNGDILLDENKGMAAFYADGEWPSNNGGDLSDYRLRPSSGYHIYTTQSRTIEVQGYALTQPTDRTVTLKTGWNSIGYAPMVNLPVATALSDYLDKAKDGDVVKSREAFAMFSVGADKSREWKGNLKYMKPGEGYMMYHQGEQVEFTYPFYEPGTFYMDGSTIASSKMRKVSGYKTTMSLVAVVEGVELQDGDQLLAFCDGELRGVTTFSDDEVLYMSIEGEKKGTLSFAIERDDDIIATTAEVMTFEGNAISGTPDEPTSIEFVRQEMDTQDGWYTLQGVKLPAQPSVKGIYIHHGKKQIIQ